MRIRKPEIAEGWSHGFGRRELESEPLQVPAAFTLIELILVMTILTIAVSVTAPALANFFRGRSLDSEARRLLALTHLGQSRAVSEGLPMELWLDSPQGKFGLEAEPSYDSQDSKALDFAIDPGIKVEAVEDLARNTSMGGSLPAPNTTTSSKTRSLHSNLPRIRFLPDGTISVGSPQKLCLTDRDGKSIWLGQSRNRLSYEIRYRSE